MDARDLATLEHENFIAYLSGAISCGERAQVSHDRGVAALLSGLSMRLFNQVLIEQTDASAEAIAEAVAVARRRGDHFAVYLREGLDDRFIPDVLATGLVAAEPDESMPGMAWHPISEDGLLSRAGPEFEVRVVTDEAGLADHVRTGGAGFGVGDGLMGSIVCAGFAQRPDCTVYVGYANGTPVSTGLGLRTGSTIGVYNISTIEPARGHGYGQAITARVVADGVAAGCDVAILQSTDMGRPIYERMGFQQVETYLGYIEPPAG